MASGRGLVIQDPLLHSDAVNSREIGETWSSVISYVRYQKKVDLTGTAKARAHRLGWVRRHIASSTMTQPDGQAESAPTTDLRTRSGPTRQNHTVVQKKQDEKKAPGALAHHWSTWHGARSQRRQGRGYYRDPYRLPSMHSHTAVCGAFVGAARRWRRRFS